MGIFLALVTKCCALCMFCFSVTHSAAVYIFITSLTCFSRQLMIWKAESQGLAPVTLPQAARAFSACSLAGASLKCSNILSFSSWPLLFMKPSLTRIHWAEHLTLSLTSSGFILPDFRSAISCSATPFSDKQVSTIWRPLSASSAWKVWSRDLARMVCWTVVFYLPSGNQLDSPEAAPKQMRTSFCASFELTNSVNSNCTFIGNRNFVTAFRMTRFFLIII